ncbi:23S rRNA (guanosine(2251)-2'-O)-methyltransferase RlmB [Comamonas sp. JC664]|uniref:23S rRNA (guanosine(2251)-2'-O)-methyltransferase RlmB n=1 Tax=Comamonas sp. JC664 TaxID=2801917 RepID=UPI0017491FA3|nr:23S rRNA (guanosine(2251)-2'-O)-methyltransferase RlmB [Comamonas sp. JC664]MBL0693296.1 23S rRNA (guanosine(2251)-2'-O)-methyltransferase RlmB [Comamonas sp. JC664]GHG71711.1 putative TrmH family tRNA/rRNA methyltransferase YacO [Comamonas sp. KCTC 72670]
MSERSSKGGRGERGNDAAPPRASRAERGGGEASRFVYGVNPVLEALRARPDEVERLFLVEGQLGARAAGELLSRARESGIRVEKVTRERLASLADGGVHQGVVVELRGFTYSEVEDILEAAKARGEPPLVVVLDGIQDPHNLGAIIRSADALGAHGVVIAKDRAVQVTGTVAKASAGAVEHSRIARVVNVSRALEELKEAGLWVAAADVGAKEPMWSARLDGPLALVVGAEGAGVREGVLKHCDFRLRIPMTGQVGSLNASVSAGILLYEVARQRGTAPSRR